MLSIQKLSTYQANYYLSLASEDYYLEGGEPPGQWFGQGCEALGLEGNVADQNFRNLFKGFSPDGQTKLVVNAGKSHPDDYHKRCPGWDLTFSAPKTVSVLWSQAPVEVRLKIQEAHRQAVRTALSMMEEFGGTTRRGKGGKIWEKASLVFSMFEHGTSRAQDPQLHTHAILFNLALRADGTTGALLSREFYQYKMAVGALYRCELAALLERELHLSIEQVETWFEVKDVSTRLVEEFSTRRAELMQFCAAAGFYDAIAAERAAIKTRGVKEHIPRQDLFEDWQETGRRFGWSEKQVAGLIETATVERNFKTERERIVQIVQQTSNQETESLTKAKTLEIFAQASQGSGLDANQVRAMAQEFYSQSISQGRSANRQTPHRAKPTLTVKHLDMLMQRQANENDFKADRTQEADGNRAGAQHSDDGAETQNSKARKTQNDFRSYADVEEPTAAEELNTAERLKALLAEHKSWEEAGFSACKAKGDFFPKVLLKSEDRGISLEIHGQRLTPNAPDWNPFGQFKIPYLKIQIEGLEQKKPLPPESSAKEFLRDPLHLKRDLTAVFDEASKYSIHHTAKLAGKIMGAGTNAKISEPKSQSDEDMFGYSKTSRRLTKFAIGETKEQTQKAMLDKWKRKGVSYPRRHLMLTITDHAAQNLNYEAHRLRLKAGALGKDSVLVNKRYIHRKERVRLDKTDKRYGVAQGDTGTVTKVTKKQINVFLDSGKVVRLPVKKYEAIEYAYALPQQDAKHLKPKRLFVLFEAAAPWRELDYLRNLAASAKVFAFANLKSAELALKEIKDVQRLEREAEEPHKRDEAHQHETGHENSHSY